MRYILVIVVVALVVTAYFRGWFGFGVNHDAGPSQTTASVTIDKKKIQDDVRDLTQRAKEEVGAITHARAQTPEKITEVTVQGQIMQVAQGQLSVRTPDDQVLKFGIVPKTAIQVGDRPGTLADLRKDEPVSVVYTDEEEGRRTATSITIENR